MDTSLHDLMDTVESIEFDAQMSVFSGFNSFLRALNENSTITQIKQLLANSRPKYAKIVLRVIDLLAESTDPQFAHPNDVAIASYLYVLSSSKEFSVLAAEKVLLVSNFMWAKRLAETILANRMVVSQP